PGKSAHESRRGRVEDVPLEKEGNCRADPTGRRTWEEHECGRETARANRRRQRARLALNDVGELKVDVGRCHNRLKEVERTRRQCGSRSAWRLRENVQVLFERDRTGYAKR